MNRWHRKSTKHFVISWIGYLMSLGTVIKVVSDVFTRPEGVTLVILVLIAVFLERFANHHQHESEVLWEKAETSRKLT